MKIQSLVLITGNEGKAKEFQELLNLPELRFSWQKLSLTEIQSAEILEISKAKTTVAMYHPDLPTGFDAVLTDDTGLYLDAIGGLPGPLVRFFLESLTLQQIFDLTAKGGQQAKATCLLGLGLNQSKEIMQFEGETLGQMVEPTGAEGFGWDPLFLAEGASKTYAELSLEEKNKISHRAKAVAKLREWIISD